MPASAALRALADAHNQTPNAVLQSLVARAAAEQQEMQDAYKGIQAGMEDFAAGRWVSLEEMDERLSKTRQAFLDAGGRP